jgi:hypothetical protein
MKLNFYFYILIFLYNSLNLNANTINCIDSIDYENKLTVDTYENGITNNKIIISSWDESSNNVFKDNKIISSRLRRKKFVSETNKNLDHFGSLNHTRKKIIEETSYVKQDIGPIETGDAILLLVIALGALVLTFLGIKYAVNKGWIVIR